MRKYKHPGRDLREWAHTAWSAMYRWQIVKDNIVPGVNPAYAVAYWTRTLLNQTVDLLER